MFVCLCLFVFVVVDVVIDVFVVDVGDGDCCWWYCSGGGRCFLSLVSW